LPLPLPLPLRISMPWLVGVDDWLASYGTEQRKKVELDRISTEERYGSFLPFTAVTERNFLR